MHPRASPEQAGIHNNLGGLIRDFNSAGPKATADPQPLPAQTTLIPKPKPSCNGSVALHTNTWGDS